MAGSTFPGVSSPFPDRLYHLVIGIVDGRRVERREVNLRRGLAVVPHGLADDAQRHLVALRTGCPTVAADIMGQFERQPHHLPDLFQAAVHLAQGVAVHIMFVED